jgi:hypothetical protein
MSGITFLFVLFLAGAAVGVAAMVAGRAGQR